MAIHKPIVIVEGPKTGNLLSVWGDTLTSVRIRDAVGHESDTCTLTFRVSPPFPAMPPRGTRYTVRIGWAQNAMAKVGVYTVQRTGLAGNPDGGHLMTVECRAADLMDGGKSVDSGHWDSTTLGAIVADVAKGLGLKAVVDPKLKGIRIPYRARVNQEAMDFLSDLADDFGAAVKVAGGQIVMTERGAGRTASGGALPGLTIPYASAYDFAFDFEPRGAYATSEGRWYDEETGTWKGEDEKGKAGKGRLGRPHPWPSKDEAREGARAAARERGRQSATGQVTLVGSPTAVAGSPVTLRGFGPDADGTDWCAESVEHHIEPGGGWITTITLETREAKKESDGDDDTDEEKKDGGGTAGSGTMAGDPEGGNVA